MDQRMLGRTGVPVSKLCLGAMMFGAWGETDHDESIRIIHAALDAGIDFIDTADVYSAGESEVIVGKALAALSDLVAAGKIRYFGHSTFAASQIVKAQWTARDRGHLPFRCEQPPYSILTRHIEHDVLPTCEYYGMGVIPYSPLAGGWLSGRYRKDAETEGPHSAARPPARFDMSDPANQRKLDAADQLAQVADGAGLTLIELALAFVLRHPAVTAAIIGPRTTDHLESQLSAADVELADEVLDRIDEIVAPGTTINVADNGWTQPSLTASHRRR